MLVNRLCYLLILLGTAAFFVCFNGYISYYVFLLSLALPLVSFAISLPGMVTMRLQLLLRGETDALARTRKGQSVPLRIEARTPWPLPCGQVRLRLTAENSMTGEKHREQLVFTAGNKALILEHALTSATCGLVTCQITKARACDLLGLVALPIRLRGKGRCAAFFYPAVYSPALSVQSGYDPDSEGERYSLTKPGDDLSELFGLRDYREGDKLSRIHWKLSQKMGRTLVKEPSLPLADCILFLLDFNGAGEDADVLLDVFATLSSFLSQQEVAHRVGYRSGRILQFLELAAPEDARPALESILAAGGRVALPGLPEQEMPRGLSHVLYLCGAPPAQNLRLLRDRYPSARLTCFCAHLPSGPTDPSLTLVLPGQVTEVLNGMVL